jgi:NAD(P)-dependent dehydrogenase (short-subunit alcohol dehydrogenase family)
MELAGKVALLTGGTRMGEAVAQSLGSRGCSVVLTWRSSRQAAQKTVAALQAQGIQAADMRCDVAREVSIHQAIQSLDRKFRRLDVVINLASIYEPSREAKEASRSWDTHLTANARSAYLLTLAAAPLMKRSGGGRVVHISDWTSASGRPRYSEYSSYYVSKTAVKAVVEALALELAPSILVNAIAPGPMLPPKGMTVKEEKAVRQATPLNRWGGADEIAKAVVFLIETDFVTGETVRVDGGRHLI